MSLRPSTGIERLVPISPVYVRGMHLMMLTTDLGFLDLYDFIPGFPDTPVTEVFSDCIAVENLRFVSLPWLRRIEAGRRSSIKTLTTGASSRGLKMET